jgi:DNA repair protein RadA/Sms
MAKRKTIFVCQECGYESSGWMGKCPSCLQWNTFLEEVQQTSEKPGYRAPKTAKALNLTDISFEGDLRTSTGIKEMDRVLGGGIASVVYYIILNRCL